MALLRGKAGGGGSEKEAKMTAEDKTNKKRVRKYINMGVFFCFVLC